MADTPIPAVPLEGLAERLLKLATGRVEWRVQDPVQKCYCMSFDHNGSIRPERDARDWLADFSRRWPDHPHAKYEVAQARVFTELEKAALEAVEALRAGASEGATELHAGIMSLPMPHQPATREAAHWYAVGHHDAKVAAATLATPVAVPRTITWPKERRVGRREDMSPDGTLVVGLDSDNDVYVAVAANRHGDWQDAAVEFCNGGGGGSSPHTRAALINLMTAIEADNAARPDKAFPPATKETTE